MTAGRGEQVKIAARCRRIGWDVVTGSGKEWLYRINMPTGEAVFLHSSPSDVNWQRAVFRALEKGGFSAAEEEWLRRHDEKRRAKMSADAKAAEAKAAREAAERDARGDALALAAGPYAIREVDIAWLLTPAKMPETRTVIVTPEAARKALDTINIKNRKKRDKRTDEFVQMIRDGDFACTHQGAAVDWNGVLIDGQHRFDAIVITNTAQQMQVSVGQDPKNFGKVDTPMVRSAADTAYLDGEVNLRTLASTARLLHLYEKFGRDLHSRGTKQRVSIDAVDRSRRSRGDDLRHAVARGLRMRREIAINPTGAAAAIYLMTALLPEGDPRPAKFFDDLEIGLGDTKDPVWMLRRRFTGVRGGRTLDQYETLAVCIKGWNFRATGKSPKTMIVWRPDESFPENIFLPPLDRAMGVPDYVPVRSPIELGETA